MPSHRTPPLDHPLSQQSKTDVISYVDAEDVLHRAGETIAQFGPGFNNQYLFFFPVTREDFAKVSTARDSLDKRLRLALYEAEELLVVKIMPTVQYESSHLMLLRKIDHKCVEMGVEDELVYTGGATFTLQTQKRIKKEADSSFKPRCRNREGDFPTLVIESGVSESVPRMRVDARLWLVGSGGEVKVVLVTAINVDAKTIILERWENRPTPVARPSTRSNLSEQPTLGRRIQIDLSSDTVTGSPLKIPFRKIFLREPGAREGDVVLVTADLLSWANGIWAYFQ